VCACEKGVSYAYNDVDTAHLLGYHDGKGGESGSSDTRDGKELNKPLDVGCVANDVLLDLNLSIDVVEVSCC